MDQIAESMSPLKQRQPYRATQARIRIQQESVLWAAPYQLIWGQPEVGDAEGQGEAPRNLRQLLGWAHA